MGLDGIAAAMLSDEDLASAALTAGTDGMYLGIIPASLEVISETSDRISAGIVVMLDRNNAATAEVSVRNNAVNVSTYVKAVVMAGRSRVNSGARISLQGNSETCVAKSVIAGRLWRHAAAIALPQIEAGVAAAPCSEAVAAKEVAVKKAADGLEVARAEVAEVANAVMEVEARTEFFAFR
jgi:hypothetical protein